MSMSAARSRSVYQPHLIILKAKLRGFEAAKRTFMSQLRKVPKDKHGLLARMHSTRAMLRHQARHHQVAYCLLRGVPYSQVEQCAPQNLPNAQLVFDIMQQTSPWLFVDGMWRQYDVNLVRALLTRPSAAALTASPAASEPRDGASLPTPSHAQTPRSILGRALKALGVAPEKPV